MMTTTRTMKRAAALIAACAMTATLTACEGMVPRTTATTTQETTAEPADLTVEQEAAIRERIVKKVNAANNAKDASKLDGQVTGPQLDIMNAQIAIASKTGSIDQRSEIPDTADQIVVPRTNGWPRMSLAITTASADGTTPRLMAFTQADALHNYRLWGSVRLFQGAELPSFAVPTVGSSVGSMDDDNLVATPKDAVAWYADVLKNGDESKHADSFDADNDYLRKELNSLTSVVQKGVEQNKGTQEQDWTIPDGQARVMRAEDGSDLVIARIDSTWTRTAGEDRQSLPASDTERALFGDAQATSGIRITYVNLIAMVIPKKDAKNTKITIVGAERQPVKAEPVKS